MSLAIAFGTRKDENDSVRNDCWYYVMINLLVIIASITWFLEWRSGFVFNTFFFMPKRSRNHVTHVAFIPCTHLHSFIHLLIYEIIQSHYFHCISCQLRFIHSHFILPAALIHSPTSAVELHATPKSRL